MDKRRGKQEWLKRNEHKISQEQKAAVKAEIDEIKEYLNLEQGLETLQDQAVQLVKDGITTVAELNKIKVYSD